MHSLAIVVVAIDNLIDGCHYLVAVARLVDNGIDIACEELAQGPNLVVHGAHNDGCSRVAGTNHLYQHKTVEIGQFKVNDVEVVAVSGIESRHQFHGIAEFIDIDSTIIGKDNVESLPHQIVVIDNGNFHL